MRLGELLVAVGDVTPQQVEEALRRQILHGSRIGSNLVELGFLSMDQLAHALGRQHQIPPVLEEHYTQIDRALAKQVTPQLAATWHAVPLGRTGDMASSIAVATTDPLAPVVLEGLQEIFKTEIVQAIAPELRLFYWLEQVYGIPRINRFKRIDTREPSDPGAEAESSERRAYVRTISDSEEVVDTSPLARIAVKRIAIPRTTDIEIPTDPNNSEQFIRSIRRATSGTSMADLVCHLLQYGFDEVFSAGMLMVARGRVLVGWKGFVRDAPDKSIDALAVPLDSPSMLLGPSASRDSFFGFPDAPASIDERLWHYLGPPPRTIAVLPIEIDDKLACMLYVQSNAPISAEHAGTLGEVSRSISACLTRLIRNAKR